MSQHQHRLLMIREYAYIAGAFLKDLATCVPVTAKELIREKRGDNKPRPYVIDL